MSLLGRVLPIFLALAAGCSPDLGAPLVEAPTGPAQSSQIAFQAVDAGTGGALTDAQMTVRYLVRSPVTLDAASSEAAPSAEPYQVVHEIAADSLIVEVRLEAPSYHRMDTVLAVARGGSAGPLTVRMNRRLERTAAAPTRPAGGPPAANRPAPGAQPSRPAADPDAGADRSSLQAGDAAFRSGDFFAAAQAYAGMPTPTGTGAYARDYQQGMVNRGVSHIELGEMGSALDALEAATDVPLPSPSAYRQLAFVLCSVGRVDDGLDAVDEIEDMEDDIPAAQRGTALALGKYEEGRCRKRTFDRTEGTLNLVSAGRSVVSAFEEFLEMGGAVNAPSADLTAAMADANTLLEEIRARMRRGGQF